MSCEKRTHLVVVTSCPTLKHDFLGTKSLKHKEVVYGD